MISFVRIIKNGLTNFWRNSWLSAASTFIMVITLVILSVLTFLFIITKYSVNTIRERVDISAYFKTGLAEDQIQRVRGQLRQDSKIKSITYISADDALRQFQDKHQNDPLITESVKELNQNPLPATLQIKANDLADYPAIADELGSDQYKATIDKVNFQDNRAIIDRLNRLLKFIITFGIALTVIFAAIAVLVIFNTITLTIYNRREEVEIMRLVGATNWYIRGPFLVEALTSSLVATAITTVLLIPVYWKILPSVSNYLNPGSDVFAAGIFRFYWLILIQLAIAVILSIVSSLWAIRRYLRI